MVRRSFGIRQHVQKGGDILSIINDRLAFPFCDDLKSGAEWRFPYLITGNTEHGSIPHTAGSDISGNCQNNTGDH